MILLPFWYTLAYPASDITSMNMAQSTVKKNGTVFLWTVPRSLSTVLTKCISFVDNVQVWFEPYSCAFDNNIRGNQSSYPKRLMNGSYWINTTTPQREMIVPGHGSSRNWFEDRIITYPWVKEQLENPDPGTSWRFIKNMAYDIDGDIDSEYLPNIKCQHTFLIRDPCKVYPSCKAAFLADRGYSCGLADIDKVNLVNDYPYFPIKSFYKLLHKLWCSVQTRKGTAPVVIDADDLRNKPERVLRKYFEAVGLQWNEKYLSCKADNEITKEWKTSQGCMDPNSERYKAWFKRALESSKFIPTPKCLPRDYFLPPDLLECVEESMPYYKEMFESRIKVDDVKL